MTKQDNPFVLPHRTPFGVAERILERIMGLNKISKGYQSKPDGMCQDGFLDFVLSELGVEHEISMGSVDNIPKTRATVIVANHPSGCIEGIILAKILLSVRPDVKILANEVLKMIPELDDLFIGVNVFGKDTARQNAISLKAAHNHLRDGGLLLVFPAGEVSNMKKRDKHKYIEDVEWSKSIASLVRKHSATTVPIYIDDKNSKVFYMARRIRPVLGTLMLGRELLRKRNRVVKLRISESIPYAEINGMSPREIVQYLRLNTYMMASCCPQESHQSTPKDFDVAVEDRLPVETIVANIENLPEDTFLFSHGDFDVYCSEYEHLDALAHELGRCREHAFRLNFSGTGKALDLDDFDKYYLHVFIWDRKHQQLVGAYRLGKVDEIVNTFGIQGLFSSQDFRYEEAFFKSLDKDMKIVELGRSFIAPEYQGHRSALKVLWQGIMWGFAARSNPEYRYFYGLATISSKYTAEARHLMIDVLRKYYYENDASQLLQGYRTLPRIPKNWTDDMLEGLDDTNRISALVKRLDNGNSIPVLLRQYMRLNGRIAGFNFDPAFNNSLDVLVVVDLCNIPLKYNRKYMGKDGIEYLKYHGFHEDAEKLFS